MTLLGPAPERHTEAQPADPVIEAWFRPPAACRRNAASGIRAHTTGNVVEPLVHGAAYFPRLLLAIRALRAGDTLLFSAYRMDGEQLLAGPDSAIGDELAAAAARGVRVFGLVWRSQPRQLEQSEQENADLARRVNDAGGEVLLDARTRRGGSHHQKLVVCRYAERAELDIAFVGGIDVARSRGDDARHDGDGQIMPFPDVYGPQPPWHDVQVAVRGPAITDLELTFRERWDGSTVLVLPSPVRMLLDRTYHAGRLTGADLPAPTADPASVGPHAVQVLRTYPSTRPRLGRSGVKGDLRPGRTGLARSAAA